MAELFDHIDELRRSPGKVAVATLVNTRGTTPRKEGAKMLVGEGGSVLGSVTIGGCVDAQVIENRRVGRCAPGSSTQSGRREAGDQLTCAAPSRCSWSR
jgi:xanthine/CO dehydrogenase XdhC/CoxF family maturation factor